MTAIVGVLNRHGAAIAADSAVTVGGKKVFNSANKVFTLSKYEPVAIAIYNNSDLINTPWEVVVKEYRKQLKDKHFDKLVQYIADFFNFLKKRNYFASEESQKSYLKREFLHSIEIEISVLKDQGVVKKEDLQANLLPKIQNEIAGMNEKTQSDFFSKEMTYSRFSTFANNPLMETIAVIRSKYGIDIPYDPFSFYMYRLFVVLQLIRNMTGLVFVGYGEKECTPSLYNYECCSVVDNDLSFYEKELERMIIGENTGASISPFAQVDVVQTFVRGVNPDLRNLFQRAFLSSIQSTIDMMMKKVGHISPDMEKELYGLKTDNTFLAEQLNSFNNQYNTLAKEAYISPFVNSVTTLEKDDLADLAESLVKLTSLRRKISPDQTTVGGPIDVMVISKGDGVVWIKRKHYFKPELNPNFFDTYLKH